MASRESAAVSVGRQGAVDAEPTAFDEPPTLARQAESESFEGEQDRDGEGVIELADIDVGRRHTRLGKGLTTRSGARRLGEIGPFADRDMGYGLTAAEDPHWLTAP